MKNQGAILSLIMLSRMDGNAELTETQHKKYQKLASEYSKVRPYTQIIRLTKLIYIFTSFTEAASTGWCTSKCCFG